MKKKITFLFATSALAVAGLVAVANKEASGAKAATSVSLFSSGEDYAESIWDSAKAYDLAVNEGSTVSGKIQFAYYGDSIAYRAVVHDTTYTVNDNPYYKISDGTNTLEMDGKYLEGDTYNAQQSMDRAWARQIAKTFEGDPRICHGISYDSTAQNYIIIESFVFPELKVGQSVSFNFAHYDSADQGWGITQPNFAKFDADLVISEYTKLNKYAAAYEEATWIGVPSFTLQGTPTTSGKIQCAVFNDAFFYKAVVKDETYTVNDNPYVCFKSGEDVWEMDGKYLEGATYDALTSEARAWGREINVSASMKNKGMTKVISYNQSTKEYTIIEGYIGSDLSVGKTVDFTFVHYNAGEGAWGITQPDAGKFHREFKIGDADPLREIVDLEKTPTDADWEALTAIPMIDVAGAPGSVDSVKVCTAKENIFFRVDCVDPQSHTGQDRLEINLIGYDAEGNEKQLYHAQGNFEVWMSPIGTNLCGSPSLLEDSSTAANKTAFEPGTLTHKHGFYLQKLGGYDYYAEGGFIRLQIIHNDTVSGESWGPNTAHTTQFDEVMKFGAKYDDTIRPLEQTAGITLESKQVLNTSAKFAWANVEGADNYKIFVFGKNAEGEKEPYTYLSAEGPYYAEAASYEEEITGLDAEKEYAFQLMVYAADGSLIGASNKIDAKTMSNAQYNEWLEEQAKKNQKSSGCGGSVIACSALISALALAGVVLLKKKED